MELKLPEDVEMASMQNCPDEGIGNSRPSTSPFVNTRLQAIENKPFDRHAAKLIVRKGYSGMSEATVSERMLMFSSNNSSRSRSPHKLHEEKKQRILREDWIRENTPIKDGDDEVENTEFGGIPRNRDSKRISQARIEVPLLLAHVKVSERVSKIGTGDENVPSIKGSTPRDEMPSLLAHVRVAERASSFSIPDGLSSARNTESRDEMPSLLAQVKVSEKISDHTSKDETLPKKISMERNNTGNTEERSLDSTLDDSRENIANTAEFSTKVKEHYLNMLL